MEAILSLGEKGLLETGMQAVRGKGKLIDCERLQ